VKLDSNKDSENCKENPSIRGPHAFSPFTSTIIKVKTRTVEAFNTLDVPTKEGLTVKSEIALLYHVKPEAAANVYVNYGTNYQEVIVESNFRAIVRHVSASYLAKDLQWIAKKLRKRFMMKQLLV
jgi:regulator of protease activity HflC (stomatin/prohibitin superfamily)